MQIFYYMTSILDIKHKIHLFIINILDINIERIKLIYCYCFLLNIYVPRVIKLYDFNKSRIHLHNNFSV